MAISDIPTPIIFFLVIILGILVFIAVVSCSGNAYTGVKKRSEEFKNIEKYIDDYKKELNSRLIKLETAAKA
jgi:hypothetical protein